MVLNKQIYLKIILEFNKKNISELLKLIQKYKQLTINSIIRQTLIHTQNFNYAIQLNDATTSVDFERILTEIFSSKYNNINKNLISNMYENSIFKKDIIKHELYKKFKHLFQHDLYLFKLIYYIFIVKPKLPKQQTLLQLRFALFQLELTDKNITTIKFILDKDICRISNIYIQDGIIFYYTDNPKQAKTYQDILFQIDLSNKFFN
jgi:hypothetical protein